VTTAVLITGKDNVIIIIAKIILFSISFLSILFLIALCYYIFRKNKHQYRPYVKLNNVEMEMNTFHS